MISFDSKMERRRQNAGEARVTNAELTKKSIGNEKEGAEHSRNPELILVQMKNGCQLLLLGPTTGPPQTQRVGGISVSNRVLLKPKSARFLYVVAGRPKGRARGFQRDSLCEICFQLSTTSLRDQREREWSLRDVKRKALAAFSTRLVKLVS